jgi:hypothetical protein
LSTSAVEAKIHDEVRRMMRLGVVQSRDKTEWKNKSLHGFQEAERCNNKRKLSSNKPQPNLKRTETHQISLDRGFARRLFSNTSR